MANLLERLLSFQLTGRIMKFIRVGRSGMATHWIIDAMKWPIYHLADSKIYYLICDYFLLDIFWLGCPYK
jgi:hypothetical protein